MKNLILTLMILVIAIAIPTDDTCGQTPISLTFSPDTLFAYMDGAIDPIEALITLSDMPGEHTTSMIDPTTLRINETLLPHSWELHIDSIGFSPDKLIITITANDLIDFYAPFYDVTYQPITITGHYHDGTSFEFSSDILLRGHASGDLNHDRSIDILDMVCLIRWLFESQELPFSDPVQADMNKDGSTNTTDLVALIRIIFFK